MNKVIVSGATGFVGQNLIGHIDKRFNTSLLTRENNKSSSLKGWILYEEFFKSKTSYDNYIHLAGKAHDLKKISSDKDYFLVNYDLTKNIYDRFLSDKHSKVFVFISSVKAVADEVEGELVEETLAKPVTAYGKSKLMAENYILNNLPEGKKVIILRPCMIHGPNNKGNLNLLYSIISKGIPWPLGAYNNKRSFLSVGNLCFVVLKILEGELESGIYNIADDEPLSTNEIIHLIAESIQKKSKIWKVPKPIIQLSAKIGNLFPLLLNEERLQKLTENYIVSNTKLKEDLGVSLPISAKEGMKITLKSFSTK